MVTRVSVTSSTVERADDADQAEPGSSAGRRRYAIASPRPRRWYAGSPGRIAGEPPEPCDGVERVEADVVAFQRSLPRAHVGGEERERRGKSEEQEHDREVAPPGAAASCRRSLRPQPGVEELVRREQPDEDHADGDQGPRPRAGDRLRPARSRSSCTPTATTNEFRPNRDPKMRTLPGDGDDGDDPDRDVRLLRARMPPRRATPRPPSCR